MKITFSQHALQQMFRRNITVEDIKTAISSGDTIQDYRDDKPYPSRILLYFKNKVPLHVVYAVNRLDNEIIVITAYHPDENLWSADFRTKKN